MVFDGINFKCVTSNLALFLSFSHTLFILWPQIQTNIKIDHLGHDKTLNDTVTQYGNCYLLWDFGLCRIWTLSKFVKFKNNIYSILDEWVHLRIWAIYSCDSNLFTHQLEFNFLFWTIFPSAIFQKRRLQKFNLHFSQ